MEHLSYGEIFNQTESWKSTFIKINKEKESIIGQIRDFKPQNILIVGCGSSYWGAMTAGRAFQKETGIKTDVLTSGDILLNKDEVLKIYGRLLVIVPSRSGKTGETVSALKIIKGLCNCLILNIGCEDNTPISSLSDINVILDYVFESSVCQTRSFTNIYLAQLLLAASLGSNIELINNLKNLLNDSKSFIKRTEADIKAIAYNSSWESGFVLANGNLYGIGCEGALIMQEMSLTHMDFYQTFEYRHGPIVLTNESSLVIVMLTENGIEYEKSVIKEIKDKGAKVLILGNNVNIDGFKNADFVFDINQSGMNEYVNAVYYILTLQMLSYHRAVYSGKNPDMPEGLVQWINI